MEQVLIGGSSDDLHVDDTEYNVLNGGATWSSVESARKQLIGADGKLKNFRVRLQNAPVNHFLFTVRVNGATLLDCLISGASTTGSNTVDEVAVSKGDWVSIECNPSAADPTVGYAYWSVVFEGDNDNESIILGGTTTTTITTDQYAPVMPGGYFRVPYSDAFVRCPCSGTLKNLYVEMQNAPGGADTFTLTLYKNAIAQTLTVTITGAATTGNDTVNEVAVAAGDTIAFRCASTVSPDSSYVWYGMTFVADTDGESMILGGTYDATPTVDGTIEYNNMTPLNYNTWTGTEADRQQLIQKCTLKNLYVELNLSPGAGDTLTFTIRKNGIDTGLSCAIADAAVKCNDTEDIAFSDFDLINMKVEVTNAPAARDSCWGACCYIAPPSANPLIGKPLVSPDIIKKAKIR